MENNQENQGELERLINDVGIKHKKVIELMGFKNKITWYRRRKDPQNFTIGEVLRLSEILSVSDEQIFKAIKQDISRKAD